MLVHEIQSLISIVEILIWLDILIWLEILILKEKKTTNYDQLAHLHVIDEARGFVCIFVLQVSNKSCFIVSTTSRHELDASIIIQKLVFSSHFIYFPISGGGFRRKRRRGVDYNEEIPFEKKPPPGFHDTSEDANYVASHNFKRLRHQDVIGNSRDDAEKVSKQILVVVVVIVFFLFFIFLQHEQRKDRDKQKNKKDDISSLVMQMNK